MKDALYRRLDEYASKSGIARLLEECEAVIVAFSGGADSSFLLDLMVSGHKDKKISAAHFNHMIRGAEADADLRFCRERCEHYGITLFEDCADVLKASREMKRGTEECARILRYSFLDTCRKTLAKIMNIPEAKVLIATAHNADDNLETVLMNLTRGSALRGLSGIPPVRDGVYIRPLLCLGSDEIRGYCAEYGIGYVNDSTNAENKYRRNLIRHEVVPVLREINPEVQLSALRCCELVSRDSSYLESVAAASLGEYAGADGAPRELLCAMEPAILSKAVILLYRNVSKGELSSSHIDRLCCLLKEGKDARYHLPDCITAYIGDELRFVKETCKCKEERYGNFEFVLEKGPNRKEKLGFILSLYDIKSRECNAEPNVYNALITTALINDKIKGTLIVRNRREHDVYRYGGHGRKVKKLFCDRKIPRSLRDRIPLVCDEEGIVWIPGFPPRDFVRADTEQEAKFILTYYRTEEES